MVPGSSHELAALLLTETIIYATATLSIPLWVLLLDKKAAFDSILKGACHYCCLHCCSGMFNPHGNSPFSHSEGFTHFHLVKLRFVSFWSSNSNPHGNSPFSRSEGFILVAKLQNCFFLLSTGSAFFRPEKKIHVIKNGFNSMSRQQ